MRQQGQTVVSEREECSERKGQGKEGKERERERGKTGGKGRGRRTGEAKERKEGRAREREITREYSSMLILRE